MVRLKDPFDRPVSNLRVSLTSRCNLSCIYCHAEGEERPGDQLSCSEIAEILRVADRFEIRHVKFTGGEPCLREDLAEIVSLVPDKMECSLTTNGTLLADMAGDLADAGLSRVNISIDSLNRETYTKIAGKDCLSDVLAGIEAALDAKLVPVKLNMVVLSGINDHEVDDFVRFVRGNRNLVLQLIELLGFRDCDHHYDLRDLETRLAKNAREIFTRRMHHRRKYCVDNAEVEIVRPHHNTEFCAYCNRLRVTSDGKLKPCLLRSDNLVDIRGASGEKLEELFREAVRRRAPYYR